MTVKASDIEVLEGLEPVRKRPGMYIGPVNTPHGLFNWAREPIDNAIDEWAAGRATHLYVEAKPDELVVADDGSGIPVEKHPKVKQPTLTVVFTRLHAGAKFGSSKSYRGKTTTGMHGVGVSVTNALAAELEVWTHRKGKWYYQRFERGEPVTPVIETHLSDAKSPARPIIRGWKKGTIVRAVPDPAIFRRQKLPVKMIEEFLRNLAYLCPGLKITFNGQRIKAPKKDGIVHLLKEALIRDKPVLFRPFAYENKDRTLQVALTWCESDESEILSFVNYLRTRQHGTHVDGLKEAVVSAIKQLEPKKAKGLSPTDLLLGFHAVIHVKVAEPSFDSQTKDRLDTIEVKEWVKDELKPALIRFFADKKSFLARILKRAKRVKEARAKFKEEVAALRKASSEARKGERRLPAKLLAAPGARPERRELFIVEGDSAGGTARQARDSSYQEVLPVRGKTINIARASAQKIFQNEEVMAIARAVGAGLGQSCDPRKARVGKVVILTDADPDGDHIRTLLLTLFVKFMRPLVEAGKVFVADPPLYVARKGNKKCYGDNLTQIEKQLGQLNGAVVTRMKGWAEASVDDLKEIALNPETRRVYRVVLTSKWDEIVLERLMGSDTQYRKLLLNLPG